MKQKEECGKNINYKFPMVLSWAEINELPPSVNAIWRSSHKNWRVFKTNKAKAWQDNAVFILKSNKQNLSPYEGKVYVRIEIHTKTKRRMDIDNRVKALQDCLAPAGIIKDDSQVWLLEVVRIMNDKTDKVRTMITQLNESLIAKSQFVWTGDD